MELDSDSLIVVAHEDRVRCLVGAFRLHPSTRRMPQQMLLDAVALKYELLEFHVRMRLNALSGGND